MTMKNIFVIFLIVFYQRVNSQKTDMDDFINIDEATMDQFRADCKAETGLDEAIHMKEAPVKEGGVAQLTAKEAKCFLKCMAVKCGLVNEKGEPTYENIVKHFNGIPEGMDMNATIKKCQEDSKAEVDLCEKVYMMEQCVAKEIMAQKARK